MKTLDFIPKNLKNLKKEVKKLYFYGNEKFLDKKIVAIVGSRRPNAYTKRIVTSIASNLAKRDIYIVSGAAMGVDAVSHMGAYPKTIAIMANSLDIIYPKVNIDLIRKMQENCLILSEYEENTKATKWSFIERNRIVVGLSDAVIIAQADLKSGSMHSAKFALEQNKPLYVIPQRIGESDGTNSLIANKDAKIIHDIDKFCDQFGKIQNLDDEIIDFCKKNPNLEKCLEKYGEKIYEYELEGKLQINGVNISIL